MRMNKLAAKLAVIASLSLGFPVLAQTGEATETKKEEKVEEVKEAKEAKKDMKEAKKDRKEARKDHKEDRKEHKEKKEKYAANRRTGRTPPCWLRPFLYPYRLFMKPYLLTLGAVPDLPTSQPGFAAIKSI